MSCQRTPRLSRPRGRYPNQIRPYRIKAALSQAELGRVLGVGKSTISAWERGLTCPVAPYLMQLAKTLSTLSEALYPEYYAPRPSAEGDGDTTA